MKILFELIRSRMFIAKGSVFFNQNFIIFTNFLLDLISFVFLCIILFWEERDIKGRQNYISTFVFNGGG